MLPLHQNSAMEMIKYRNVEILRKELVVLKHVNLTVNSGEFVYLIGRVGSGKSSLMKSMYAEIPLYEGDAEVLGYNLPGIKRSDIPMLRRKIGIVFQDFQLLSDRNVYENLHFVLEATGWKDKKVGMSNKSYKMPHELSGGEQQRIVIARALLNRPTLILADEPTGNLDPETGDRIVALLHEISRNGTAVVMATHNLAFSTRFPGRVITCENKQVIETAE